MKYQSTRDSEISLNSKETIIKGISNDGGLFVPKKLEKLSFNNLNELKDKTYKDLAKTIFKLYLTDFSEDELNKSIDNAYSKNNFESDDIVKINKLNNEEFVLELYHGKTFAFKDIALQILPYLMKYSKDSLLKNKEIYILTATSGDTGKAALEGFKDVSGINVIVFYPYNKVSLIQKAQMQTQSGNNVHVCAVKGNFDDAQTEVKSIFTNDKLKEELDNKNIIFSSANSINWGRLLPQIVYYFYSYLTLLRKGEIKLKEKINICVPTGNFGNILAAFYAKQMGLNINKLICASNKNNVLSEFIRDGVYNIDREFYTTISPSMDIIVSSNLERLIYCLSENDSEYTKGVFDELKQNKKFEVNKEIKDKIDKNFYSGYATETQTKKTIREVFKKHNYLIDTHTAVAFSVYNDYKKETNDKTKTIIVSTANPYKFPLSVLNSISDSKDIKGDEFELIEKLSKTSKTNPPQELKKLKDKKIIFSDIIEVDNMKDYVVKIIKKDKGEV